MEKFTQVSAVAAPLMKPNIDTDAERSSFDEEGVYRHYGLTSAPPATPRGRRLGRR